MVFGLAEALFPGVPTPDLTLNLMPFAPMPLVQLPVAGPPAPGLGRIDIAINVHAALAGLTF